jgi:hypothetical protein
MLFPFGGNLMLYVFEHCGTLQSDENREKQKLGQGSILLYVAQFSWMQFHQLFPPQLRITTIFLACPVTSITPGYVKGSMFFNG